MTQSDHDLIVEMGVKIVHIRELLESYSNRIDGLDRKFKDRYEKLEVKVNNNTAWRNKMLGVAAAGASLITIVINFVMDSMKGGG